MKQEITTKGKLLDTIMQNRLVRYVVHIAMNFFPTGFERTTQYDKSLEAHEINAQKQ